MLKAKLNAKGVNHISPAQRAGFIARDAPSPERALHLHRRKQRERRARRTTVLRNFSLGTHRPSDIRCSPAAFVSFVSFCWTSVDGAECI